MRFLKRFVYASGSLLIIAVVALWFAVRASLPQLDGERALAGLTAPVHVSRDETGVVTVLVVLAMYFRLQDERARREFSGYIHMPGGQSGHPMSPFYDAGHRAWAEGQPTPFLPGPDKHRLTLSPAS